jgi:hypothetical protein
MCVHPFDNSRRSSNALLRFEAFAGAFSRVFGPCVCSRVGACLDCPLYRRSLLIVSLPLGVS